jgi:hypothetical protein
MKNCARLFALLRGFSGYSAPATLVRFFKELFDA